MITRIVRLQLVAFLLITVAGVGYAGFRYAGFGDLFGATTYPVRVQLAASGGIFTGADVAYRGVSVGRVGPLTLTPDGVEVQLDIRNDAPAIPADVDAAVRNLSAIGEQYVDLQPTSDGEPYLEAGTVIPVSRTTTPVPVEELVVSLDDFVRSVPLDSLRTVVDELGVGFADTAQPLQKLLDTTDLFTQDAVEALPQTVRLIQDGRTVLTTQNEVSGSFKSFSRDLALLADQLAESDPDLRRLIETGPEVSTELQALLRDSGSEIGQLVADLLTISRVAEPRQDGLQQILVTYPGVAANTYTVAPADGTAHLGLAINLFDPYACSRGYESTDRRAGDDVRDVPQNRKAYCAEPPGSEITVRGAQNVPRAETPKAAVGAPSGPPREGLPAGTAPPEQDRAAATPPLSSLTQILLG
ncbi:MlaD family protein [Pseudonocardia kunmingensis]|uniref:Phospholipid/cholesterol/gamma-HCH transport system substrate-binding protein n=1 Tax=Pseudonocardia kunmingensis TaxID=630975 RepID=A0A543E1H7_9PSEU|nr:MlaD family protein [Pseudonocardia kunmingensis]TQM15446.1 phospholipid/cholesterol/gamma-HCH transport system substrate-binding protein [Pseudonocardia kunmingensis]